VSPNFRNSSNKQSITSVDRLFVLLQSIQALAELRQDKEHTIFTWKTSSLTEVKNHDLPLVGFSHNPLNGPKCYKVTHTRPTSLGHTYLVFPRQATRHNILVPLDLDTLNSLITREMNKDTLLSCFYSQAHVRYNMLLIISPLKAHSQPLCSVSSSHK